jgi:2'-5' RNA ligase
MNQNPIATQTFTVRNVRRDFPKWHLGRPAYALWALEFDTDGVMSRMQAAHAHLAPWLLDDYSRQPHITLSLCGFPTQRPQHADDFGPARLRAQMDALRQLQPAPFAIDVGGLDTFTSVPYLAVHDDGGQLQALHNCLAVDDLPASPGSYTPHITVGLYADAWPMAAMQAALGSLVWPERLRVQVTGISLLSYAASVIGGPLQRLASYEFANGALHWHGEDPFAQKEDWHKDC